MARRLDHSRRHDSGPDPERARPSPRASSKTGRARSPRRNRRLNGGADAFVRPRAKARQLERMGLERHGVPYVSPLLRDMGLDALDGKGYKFTRAAHASANMALSLRGTLSKRR